MSGAEQIELFQGEPCLTRADLEYFLSADAPREVRVTVTRNRVSMLSIAFPPSRKQAVAVRLHAKFLEAPESVLLALRHYLHTRRRESWGEVSRYARSIAVDAEQRADAGRGLSTRGRVYDLAAVYADVNRTFFNGGVRCRIGWGRERPSRRRSRRSRSIRYGSWNPSTRIIRIHPLLDDKRVPAAFVRYIVFHEMLHAVVPEERRADRRYDHSPRFRRLERQYPDIGEMHRTAKALLDVLV